MSKNLILIIFFVAGIYINISAEVEPHKYDNLSFEEDTLYFPLAVGNKWQYMNIDGGGQFYGQSNASLVNVSVDYDTLIMEKKYYRINGGGYNGFFRYGEDSILYKFDNNVEKVQMDFSLNNGAHFLYGNTYTAFVKTGTAYIFNRTLSFKGMTCDLPPQDKIERRYADSLGQYYEYYYSRGSMGFFSTYTRKLIGAIINDSSTRIYKQSYAPTILVDDIFLSNSSTLALGIKAKHYYDYPGSSADKDFYYIDTVKLEYYFTNGIDSTQVFNIIMNQQAYTNFYYGQISFIDSLLYKTYSFKYRFSTKDKALIPESYNIPNIGFYSFYLDPTNVRNDSEEITFQLFQNYPNPFNPVTNIRYTLKNRQYVQLKVYDILGNEVAQLIDEEQSPGIHQTEFNGAGLSSGFYFYRLTAGGYSDTKKMLLIK